MEKNAYSIQEFCQRYSLSRSAFYKLRGLGDAPQIFKAGKRVLISKRAAESWVAKLEAEAAAKSAA